MASVESKVKPIILSVHSHKGGVGKTTICYNIVKGLIDTGFKHYVSQNQQNKRMRRILIIDLDSQMNLTSSLLMDKGLSSEYKRSLESWNLLPIPDHDIFDTYLMNHIDVTPFQNPAQERNRKSMAYNVYDKLMNRMLPNFERDSKSIFNLYDNDNNIIHLIPGSADTYKLNSLIDRQNDTGVFREIIKRFYRDMSHTPKYDLILVDLSPDLSSLNQLFLAESNYLLCPMTPDSFSKISIKLLKRNFFDEINPDVRVLGGVLSRVKMIDDDVPRDYEVFLNNVQTLSKLVFNREVNSDNILVHDNYGYAEFSNNNPFIFAQVRPFESAGPLMSNTNTSVFDVKGQHRNQKKIIDELKSSYDEMIKIIFSRMSFHINQMIVD